MKITKIKSTNSIEGIGTIAVLEIMSDEKVEVSELPESIGGYTIGAGSIVRTPDGDFAVRGEEEWGDWRTHGGGGGGSELPEVTSDDNGDVLTVVEGVWAKATPPEGLPAVTSDDNGDYLRVVDGQWAKATVTNAESEAY